MMIMNVSFEMFCEEFTKKNRKNNFSYEGKKALFSFITKMESETGDEQELDIIALCCSFTEYTSAIEAALELLDEVEDEQEAIKLLSNYTIVIKFQNGIIIQNF